MFLHSNDPVPSNPERPELSLVSKETARIGLTAHAGQPEARQADAPPPRPAARPRGALIKRVGRGVATIAIALVATLVGLLTWQYYVMSPWTRNGSIRVQVANVAPQVSGQIVDLKVSDNQFVHKGDVLYVIDPFDFQVSAQTAKASLDQKAADLEVKKAESDRRQHLSPIATTPEEQQVYAGNAAQAKAAFDGAQQALAQAQVNLQRTKVLSPVTGYVTNLLLRAGDYATEGVSNVSIIDSDSFWIDGYFEETKLANICVGDRAEATLMGFSRPIIGHVETVTRGISVSNATPGTQGLPSVDPIYTWVRLAQRVPIRVAIDQVPAGVPLVSGLTATVTIIPPAADGEDGLDRVFKDPVKRLAELYYGPQPRPGCVPVMTSLPPSTESVPASKQPLSAPANQLEPDIAPGIDVSPRKPG